MSQTITSESPTVAVSNVLLTNTTICRPAFSWCSKCGQSMEISTESNLYKSKTNYKFRKIFNFEESEVLVKTFSCALVDDILLQGTLYASQNYFCFFSRIANKQKKIIMSIEKIVEITKEKTAGIFPNAIAIRTEHNRHLFASFVHREIAFRCLNEVWANRQDERFPRNWTIGFNEGIDSKDSQDLEIDVETESLIIETPVISNILTTEELAGEEEEFAVQFPEVGIIKSRSTSINPVTFPTKLPDINVSNDEKETDLENSSSIINRLLKNSVNPIFKEKIQLGTAIVVLIFLTLYIIILAWKIHDFQVVLIEKFSLSCSQFKSNMKNIECSTYDAMCKSYKESVLDHQTKMSKVLSNLKDTLNLLQNVVEISGQMFSKLRPPSISTIIGSNIKSPGDS